MPLKKFLSRFKRATKNTGSITRVGLGTMMRDPSIFAYPILAALFILLTYSFVSGAVIGLWHHIAPHTANTTINGVQQSLPTSFREKLGIVSFSYFYTTLVTTYFTIAAAAAVMAKLEGHPTTVLHGLTVVGQHFFRVTRFALLSIFYIPLAIFAQRRKLPKGIVGVVGSSVTLHTANLAPAIIEERTSVTETVRRAINTLGEGWREGFVIKLGTWLSLLFLATMSFLPSLIGSYWTSSSTWHWLSWLTSWFLAFTLFVVTKVIGGVLLTVLYFQAKTNPKKFK